MATGSYMTPIYSRSQSEVLGDLHNSPPNLETLRVCRRLGVAWVTNAVAAKKQRKNSDGSATFIAFEIRCRNCGGGDRGRVAIYRPSGNFAELKIVLSPVWCSRPTTGVPLAHATMNFVGLDLTASDRWHQTTTTTTLLCLSLRSPEY
ncbi:hypothetical protein TNCV_4005961 [Trichonephila clavipes]|nr:hypothetical protein TNCV_4005961 [Trichonephila clavipes]